MSNLSSTNRPNFILRQTACDLIEAFDELLDDMAGQASKATGGGGISYFDCDDGREQLFALFCEFIQDRQPKHWQIDRDHAREHFGIEQGIEGEMDAFVYSKRLEQGHE